MNESEIANYFADRMPRLVRQQDEVAAAKKAFEEFKANNPEFLRLEADYRQAKDELASLEQEIRTTAVEVFEETNETDIAVGVKIKLFSTINYDVDEATEWAKNNAPMLMKLDTKAFEKIVKSSGASVQVRSLEISKKPVATIAKDLSAWRYQNGQ